MKLLQPPTRFLLVLTLLACCPGCSSTTEISEGTRVGIYARASRVFDQAFLLKPSTTEGLTGKLAPLFVREVVASNPSVVGPHTVLAWTNSASLQGVAVQQVCYAWSPGGDDARQESPQGVRITLDSAGQPILWEVLRDTSGARILFVSQSLEAAAMKAFPSPLPGRQFWIERPVSAAPETVVARILDDPQVVMGPIIYVEADAAQISTVICRCMDAQARELVGQGEYELRCLGDEALGQLPRSWKRALTTWLPRGEAEDLSRCLRLPGQLPEH